MTRLRIGWLRCACAACALLFALPAHAALYVVTIAGLGGEPDYDQRFRGNAKDMDRAFKSAGGEVHETMLSGADATRRHRSREWSL